MMTADKIREWLIALVVLGGAMAGVWGHLDAKITKLSDTLNSVQADVKVLQQKMIDHEEDDRKVDRRLDRLERGRR